MNEVKLSRGTKHIWKNKKRYTRFGTVYTDRSEAQKKSNEINDSNHTFVRRIYTENNEEVYGVYFYPRTSKRKSPITFGRGTGESVKTSQSKSTGIGRGWHRESQRHRKASIKGWKGRK